MRMRSAACPAIVRQTKQTRLKTVFVRSEKNRFMSLSIIAFGLCQVGVGVQLFLMDGQIALIRIERTVFQFA